MITESNGVFHIQSTSYSYLFKINKWGIPEHLHFGVPVQTEDVEALSCRPGLGWGCSVLLAENDTARSLDALALEWSGSGRGDYRESPVELAGVSTDFRYERFVIHEGSPKMTCGLPQAHDAQGRHHRDHQSQSHDRQELEGQPPEFGMLSQTDTPFPIRSGSAWDWPGPPLIFCAGSGYGP